jgi:hypothetical protein
VIASFFLDKVLNVADWHHYNGSTATYCYMYIAMNSVCTQVSAGPSSWTPDIYFVTNDGLPLEVIHYIECTVNSSACGSSILDNPRPYLTCSILVH